MPLDFIEKRGLHRVEDGWGTENSVIVSWGSFGLLTLPESQYRMQDYQPPLDELPWKETKTRL